MKTIKEKSYFILNKYPTTRDSDYELVIRYRNEFLGVNITREQASKIMRGPAMKTITRYRQAIQNNDGELKSSHSVQLQRSKHQRRFRNEFGSRPSKKAYSPHRYDKVT